VNSQGWSAIAFRVVRGIIKTDLLDSIHLFSDYQQNGGIVENV
jgi:hypothetical protein